MAMTRVLVAKETVIGFLHNVVRCAAGGSSVEMAPIEFEYRDIKGFTKNFSKEIREGGCAVVYEGSIPICNPYKLPKQKVAVKKLLTMRNIRQFETEVGWLEVFQHEGIVRYIGRCKTEDDYFIVLELMKKTDLSKNIHALNWNETLKILRQIATTISYMHSFDLDPPGLLVIGDLKCANILLDEGNMPKLCDFGSTDIEGAELKDYTPTLADPHALHTRVIEQSNDLYLFGVIILQLIMNESAAAKDGKRIRTMAEEHLEIETNTHLVHSKLLESGCSESDACTISNLAMKLTETQKEKKQKQAGPLQKYYDTALEGGKQMAAKIEGAGPSTSGNEICEESSSTSGNGNGSGSGNGSEKYEEPDRGKIQDAIETLESLHLEESKSKSKNNKEKATEQLQKGLNWFKKSVSKSRN